MRKPTLLIIFLICFIQLIKSQEKKILFIGNSYTFIEDIPNMFYEVANSTGDILYVDAQTAGSATFEYHATSQLVTDKINSENWDYVVLQGQSVEVALTGNYFDTNVAPFADQLVQTIKNNNSCTQPVFYNTWGREFGMASGGPTCSAYPWTCTYHGMDNALAQNYMVLADTHDAIISPVGPVWRYMRDNLVIVDLYIEDESHQSLQGAYASACTFYATILRKDPTLITYNAGIHPVTAAQIRSAVKAVVYDQLGTWKIGEFDPESSFTFVENNAEVSFTNTSLNAETYAWDFGDTNTSTEENPTHTYSQIGDYNVELEVTKCGETHSYSTTVNVSSLSLEDNLLNKVKLYPNPSHDYIKIEGLNLETIKSFKLFNVLGKQLPAKFSKTDGTINMSELASGNYFLEITSNTGSKSIRKVLKK